MGYHLAPFFLILASMQGFLDIVSAHLPDDNHLLGNTCVLLPTKRACHYFRSALISRRGQGAVWLPEILSLREFLFRESPLVIAADEDLIALLYSVYTNTLGLKQEFSAFYAWGQAILKDFDDIDKYLVEPEHLFHYVRAVKTLERENALSEEQLVWLRQFWDAVGEAGEQGIRARFLETWEQLGALYAAFREALFKEGIAYEGMAYRHLLGLLEGGHRLPLKYCHIVGFNALSTFEERLFLHLERHYETRLYWDASEAQLGDESDVSGRFIRRYARLFSPDSNRVVTGGGEAKEKLLEVVDAGQDADQCRAGLELAARWGASDTVLVLADESLVLPLLYRLDADSGVNLTMGYPARVSGVIRFLENLRAFHEELLAGKGIRVSLVESLLAYEPLAEALGGDVLQDIRNYLKPGLPAHPDDLMAMAPPAVWQGLLETGPVLPYFRNALAALRESGGLSEVESAVLQACLREIEGLETRLERMRIPMADREAGAFLLQRLSLLRVPFAGQDSEGLQVMGFLETRNLDFANVIILGACDEFLPGSQKSVSFIPFSVRRALGLPTYSESDAIYAYHFYRLIKRADRVGLVYSLQSPTGKRSRSRLAEQLLYAPPEGMHLSAIERQFSLPVPPATVPGRLEVDKNTPEVRQGLERFLNGEKQLSASAINTYIRCPVQFYLTYVAGLEEPENQAEGLDQRDLGLLFHKAMELFYRPALDQGIRVDAGYIAERMRQSPPGDLVTQAMEASGYTRAGRPLTGRILLIKRVITELIKRILGKDSSGDPFRIIGLESRLLHAGFDIGEGRTVSIKGFLDRIDRVESPGGDYVRIIDYKSGKPSYLARRNKSPEDYFEGYFTNPNYSEGLQAYLYSWLYRRQVDGLPLRAGFYSARNLQDGLMLLQYGEPLGDGDFQVFESRLRLLLQEMFDLCVPFVQSDRPDAYQYSAYAMLVE